MSTTIDTPRVRRSLRQAARAVGSVFTPPGHSARILDAALMGLIVVRFTVPGIPIPFAQAGIIALLGLCLFRRPPRRFGLARWFPVLSAALMVFLVVETLVNDGSPWKRAINIGVLMVMAAFLASGRIDVASAIKGILVALAVNAALFYLQLAPNDYQGRLTGFLGDKNAGALVYACGALLGTLVVHRRRTRALILLAGAVAVVLTDSRTTMAAYAIAVAWYLLAARLQRGFQIIVGIAFTGAFLWANDNLAEIGEYKVERAGSDYFRARIGLAAAGKVAHAPWYGSGLGQATVNLDGSTWFFHDSYLGLRVEGGVIFLVAMLAMYALAGLGFAARTTTIDVTGHTARAIAAATLVVLFCATRLGEVFMAPIGFVVLGVGLAHLAAMTGLKAPPHPAPHPAHAALPAAPTGRRARRAARAAAHGTTA